MQLVVPVANLRVYSSCTVYREFSNTGESKNEFPIVAGKTKEASKLLKIHWYWLCFDSFYFLRVGLNSIGGLNMSEKGDFFLKEMTFSFKPAVLMRSNTNRRRLM